MNKLTPRQEEVLAFIKNYIEETGYPPTRADIANELGFKSANASEEHLKALARKGGDQGGMDVQGSALVASPQLEG